VSQKGEAATLTVLASERKGGAIPSDVHYGDKVPFLTGKKGGVTGLKEASHGGYKGRIFGDPASTSWKGGEKCEGRPSRDAGEEGKHSRVVIFPQGKEGSKLPKGKDQWWRAILNGKSVKQSATSKRQTRAQSGGLLPGLTWGKSMGKLSTLRRRGG